MHHQLNDRVIIHVPYYIKTIKHIRTIVKQEEKKKNDNKWEVLGYSIGEPIIPEASEIFGHEEKYNNLLWNHDESQKKLMQLQQLAAAYKALKFGL
ncbi:hypothetical protein HCN44_001284 [Aphidius gifuensis]|uniref:Uncharacterized protein n=1 Tax=Aphidius gifuensis TaxID=684658 RepID=A0A834XPW1_APHGI|nr:hypothetical protein HCN44_001284 [Aphidius gifuensis]